MTTLRLLAALALLCIALPAAAVEGTTLTLAQIQELFRAGNTAYQQQDFEAARKNYLQLVDGGVRAPQIYFNLGTASARLNHKAEAVLYLSRARELDPHDADVNANLARVAPASVVSTLSASHPLQWISNRLSLDEWIGLFLVVYYIAAITAALYLYFGHRPRALKLLAWSAAGVCLLILVFGGRKYYERYYLQYAVVAKSATSVRSGPADTFAQVDTLPEGDLVKHLGNSEEGWSHVQLLDGRTGYVQAAQIFRI